MNFEEAQKMVRFAAGAIGEEIILSDGTTGTVVDASEEHGRIWLYPTNGRSDIGVWPSAVASINGQSRKEIAV